MVANVTLSVRLSDATASITAWMPGTPRPVLSWSVWSNTSSPSPGSVWLSPPNGMCSVITGATLAAISAAAASAWPCTSLVVIDASVVDRLCDSSRTCCWLDAIASRNAFCSGVPSALNIAFSWLSVVSRIARSLTTGSVAEPVSSCLSCVGEIVGSVRPENEIISSALPPRADRDRLGLHRAQALEQMLGVDRRHHLVAGGLPEQAHRLRVVAVNDAARRVVKEVGAVANRRRQARPRAPPRSPWWCRA